MTVSKEHTIEVAQVPRLAHDEAQDLFIAEVGRTVDLLSTLSADDWARQTDCPAWDVRRLYLHVLGAAESGASLREFVHQLRAGSRYRRSHGVPPEAALSHIQVAEREHLTADEILPRLRVAGPAAARSRRRLPGPVRALRVNADPEDHRWSLGYLNDTIYLRDLWMHRVDATQATGRAMALTPEHDGRIVADVVVEWAERHGQPFALELTGRAGGTYTHGDGTVPQTMDAVEFCRILAGRGEASGLLSTRVPF